VNASESSRGVSSLQSIGVETGAPFRARVE